MSRKRVWEIGAGVLLILAVAGVAGGWYAMRERQRRLNQQLRQVLQLPLGDSRMAIPLLHQGASVHTTGRAGQTNGRWTVLMDAAWDGDLDLTREALQQGAKVNARDEDGATALHVACRYEKPEVVRELLAHGAAVDVKDARGVTPLACARSTGNPDIVRLLAQHGATK